MADGLNIQKPEEDAPPQEFGNIVLEYAKSGTPVFHHRFKLYYFGEHVANLLSHGRDPKIIKEGVVKVELLNHILYSTEVMEVYEAIIESLGLHFRNLTRLDIAIDGYNYLYEFLNAYAKQPSLNEHGAPRNGQGSAGGKKMVMKVGKARFDAKVQDKNFMFQNFKIGTGGRSIAVYNKSAEINKVSRKEYIYTMWQKNGLQPEGRDIWRCELRMGSSAAAMIKDFDLKQALSNPNYTLSVFRTLIKGFFEFRLKETDGNVSRMREIDLFDFNLLQVSLLEKIPRYKVDGAYKAQMGIHNDVRSIVMCYMRDDTDVKAALTNISRNVEHYNLRRWYERKLPEWITVYTRLMPRKQHPYEDVIKELTASLHPN